MQNPKEVQQAAACLLERLPAAFFKNASPPIGIILGTGLSFLADSLEISENACAVTFSELPHFPDSSVKSHAGKFVFGLINSIPVLAQAGRLHIYEGRTPSEVCMGVRIMAAAGIKTLILTNAAGSINPLFPCGAILCISDIINHTGLSPLTGVNHNAWGPRFPDMSQVFSKKLQKLANEVALENALALYNGVYLGVHGPELETPAETRMYRQWGADAVGMSTVLEAICARHLGMNLLGFSCLTNQNLPDCLQETKLEDILATAKKCGADLGNLLYSMLPRLFAMQSA